MQLVAQSDWNFYIATDWLEVPIQVNLQSAAWMRDPARGLREHQVTKTELRTGEYNLRTWRRAMGEGWRGLMTEARPLAKNPLWEVIIDVIE